MSKKLAESAPRDDLVRVLARPDDVEVIRAADDAQAPAGRTLTGRFAVFNQWTEIDSYMEGHFLERIAPGAFRKTFAERAAQIQCIYEHGMDFTLNNKPLGPVRELREDKVGAYYEVPLIDTDYNRDFIIPAADAGLLGASFRFKVVKDEWEEPPEGTAELPKRTILECVVYEFGPCPFPAYAGATADLRSRWLNTYRLRASSSTNEEAAQQHPEGAGPSAGTTPQVSDRSRRERLLDLKGIR